MRIPERQAEIDDLTRKYLSEPKAEENGHTRRQDGSRPERAAGLPTPEEVIEVLTKDSDRRAIFEGENLHYSSDSEGDGRLFSNLAFFCQRDIPLMREVAERSARKRQKWYSKRGAETWLDRELKRAAHRTRDVWARRHAKAGTGAGARRQEQGGRDQGEATERPSPFQRSALAKALEDGVPEPEVLVPEILLAGKVHSIYSGGGTGKTFYAAYVTREVLERGGSVLYFDQENGLRIMAERAECLGISPEMAQDFYHYPFPTMPLDPEVLEAFEQLLDAIGPDLVVFDSWVNLLAMCGLDENSSVDIATWTEAYAQKARHRDIAVLILDHIPKEGGSARGSGRKLDYVDVMWELRNPQPFDRTTVGRIDLHLRKDREGWLPRVLTYSVGGGENGFIFKRSEGTTEPKDEAGLTAKERATLEALEALGSMGAFDREWKAEAESRNVKKSKYYEAKKRLLDLDLVENVMNKFFVKDLQKRGPVESSGVQMDLAGEEVQFGPGGLDPGPTGPPVDQANEEHSITCLCEECLS